MEPQTIVLGTLPSSEKDGEMIIVTKPALEKDVVVDGDAENKTDLSMEASRFPQESIAASDANGNGVKRKK
jgi:hypothetical protein